MTTALLILVKGERRNFSWDNAKKMMLKVDQFKALLEESMRLIFLLKF